MKTLASINAVTGETTYDRVNVDNGHHVARLLRINGGQNMIKCIDLRGSDTGYRFAFWDTTTDTFCDFGGKYAWDTAADFIEAYQRDNYGYPERFTSLIPAWANTAE